MPASMFGKVLKFTEQTSPSEIIDTTIDVTNVHRKAASYVLPLTSYRPETTSMVRFYY
jgi:hypothetical protein